MTTTSHGTMYRELNLERTQQTINVLKKRIEERFPDSGLSKVGVELCEVANETEGKIQRISKPIWWLRISLGSVILLGIVVIVFSISHMDLGPDEKLSMLEFAGLLEASVNELVLIGAGFFFLFTLESRFKRAKALTALHELRSIAHVVDMHQLTKDPTDRKSAIRPSTPSSPERTLSDFELNRYLDYCSEMLSLLGKLAALYTQHFPDETVLAAVNELENLTSGISNKIWQKIIILQSSGPA